MMRPAGPLPARVYWVRRALLAVVVLLVLSMFWWAVGRAFGGGAGDSGGAAASGTQPPGDGGGSGPAVSPGQQDQSGPGDAGSGGKHGGPRKHSHKPAHRQPVVPSGPCAPENVRIDVRAGDVKAGQPDAVALRLTSVATPACTLAITSDTLALRITDDADGSVVWSSDDCPNDVLARELTVQAHQPVVYTFDWDGHRSTETCAQPGKVADAGSYQVEAALIGADVFTAAFAVT